MDEAREIQVYLPISFNTRSEEEYVAFLWDSFESNYTNEKYQFAFLAFHMLTMCAIYFNIWHIKLARPLEFQSAMVGFNKDLEKELMEATSPFIFWRVNESNVMRFLKLIGCENDMIGRCSALVKERNNSAHANGNIFYSDATTLDRKVSEVLSILSDIEQHSEPIIEESYRTFLLESGDPEDREYPIDEDQIREVLIHPNYLSSSDVGVCRRFEFTSLDADKQTPETLALHEALSREYPPPE